MPVSSNLFLRVGNSILWGLPKEIASTLVYRFGINVRIDCIFKTEMLTDRRLNLLNKKINGVQSKDCELKMTNLRNRGKRY